MDDNEFKKLKETVNTFMELTGKIPLSFKVERPLSRKQRKELKELDEIREVVSEEECIEQLKKQGESSIDGENVQDVYLKNLEQEWPIGRG